MIKLHTFYNIKLPNLDFVIQLIYLFIINNVNIYNDI